jgi:exonuclease SbcC
MSATKLLKNKNINNNDNNDNNNNNNDNFRLILKNFRKYDDFDISFKFGDIVLIKGRSGSGKSTLFEAIFWCLYGKKRNIKNFNNLNKKTYVILQFDKYVIYRQSTPNVLRFHRNDYLTGKESVKEIMSILSNNEEIMEDNAAEDNIEKIFGLMGLWKASSYLEQGSRCSFLYESNTNKMNLLNRFSFLEEDPKLIIDKIKEKIDEYKKNFDETQVEYDTKKNFITKKLKSRNFNTDVYKDLLLSEGKTSDIIEKLVVEKDICNFVKIPKNTIEKEISNKEKNLENTNTIIENLKQEVKQFYENKAKYEYIISNLSEKKSVTEKLSKNLEVNPEQEKNNIKNIDNKLDIISNKKDKIKIEYETNKNKYYEQNKIVNEKIQYIKNKYDKKYQKYDSDVKSKQQIIDFKKENIKRLKNEYEINKKNFDSYKQHITEFSKLIQKNIYFLKEKLIGSNKDFILKYLSDIKKLDISMLKDEENIGNFVKIFKNITDEDIKNNYYNEKKYNESKSIINEFGISYDKKSVQESINKLTEQIKK